ncbi:MAG: hypothetical protein IPK07_25810 [Deltaproteobacteria bacterium]|jgi:hypothetical protein|nr:hypothetical protein [Deltaproteobacteria bacterium]
MITLERFRRELGGACPEADAEALAVFEQLSIVADVVVASLRGRPRRTSAHERQDRHQVDRRAHACDVTPLDRLRENIGAETAEGFEERAAILEFDGNLPRGQAEAAARKQSRRKRRG